MRFSLSSAKSGRNTRNDRPSAVLPLVSLATWIAVIFVLSAQSGLGVRGEPTALFYLERKGAHVIEYFVLAWLSLRAFRALLPLARARYVLALAVAFSLCYALSDEIHQTFVAGREGKLTDVGIDLIGIALFVVGYVLGTRSRGEDGQAKGSRPGASARSVT